MIDDSPSLLRESIGLDTTLNEINRLSRADGALEQRVALDERLKLVERSLRVRRAENSHTQAIVHFLGVDCGAEHCLVAGSGSVDGELDGVGLEFNEKGRKHADALNPLSMPNHRFERMGMAHGVLGRHTRVPTRRGDLDTRVEVALLANGRNCKDSTILLTVSSYSMQLDLALKLVEASKHSPPSSMTMENASCP